MIDHSQCEHPRTSSARAKCRRSGGNYKEGEAGPHRKVMGKKEREERDTDTYGQTPRDRDKECVNCGVERITMRGTDPLTGLLLYVGDKCAYMVKRSPDITPIE